MEDASRRRWCRVRGYCCLGGAITRRQGGCGACVYVCVCEGIFLPGQQRPARTGCCWWVGKVVRRCEGAR